MKKLTLISALALILGLTGNSYAQGGFTGPTISRITVKEALELITKRLLNKFRSLSLLQ